MDFLAIDFETPNKRNDSSVPWVLLWLLILKLIPVNQF